VLPSAAWEAALTSLSPDRRADPNEALQIGARLIKALG
jgi:hypothetical protein